jgi:hypothetical protein
VDVIALPSHGTVDATHHDAGCRRKATCGTTHFFPAATASAGFLGRRYPLAMCRVRAQQSMESSYRQSQQVRMRTRSRTPDLRLLFMGRALVLRNVGGWWYAEVMAQPQRGARQLRPQSLRFARLLVWLLIEVANHHRLLQNLPVYQDLYARAQAFGITSNY